MKRIVNLFLPWLILPEIAETQERILIIMSANQDKIDALTTKVEKIYVEVQKLKEQPGAETLDFTRLESAVGQVDDINPDETVDDGSGDDTQG